MSTLFDNTSLPLWLWIVIIVVGSLCIIGGVAVVVVCMLRRRRTASSVPDLPTRRVTVRRGRVVPASHYLSLTGSKFGLNAFEEDARTTRSKSPFEWWNTLKDKRRSQHLDDISTLEASPEGKPQIHDIYTRRDYARSQTSLNNQEKDPMADIQEIEPAEPSPTLNRPARHTSFSRPFQAPQYEQSEPGSPMWSQRRNRNLSMIKESSPHASMVSARSLERRSSRLSAYNPGEPSRQERRPSAQRSEHRRPSTGSQRQRPSPAESRQPSDSSQRQRRSPPDNRRTSDHSSRRPSDRSSASSGRQQRPAPPSTESWTSLSYHNSHEEVPRPIAYRGSRHSLGEQEGTNSNGSLSKRSSLVSRHDSLTDYTELTRRPSRPKSLVLDDATRYQQHQGPEYWAGRAEMMPEYGENPPQPPTPTTPTTPTSTRAPSIGRVSSKKGNVLRKKSLKRQEMVSYVGT